MINSDAEKILGVPVQIQPPPFSPWMTLAILHVVREVESEKDVRLVTVGTETQHWAKPYTSVKYLDGFVVQLQIEGTSQIVLKETGTGIEVKPGDLVFVPPGAVYSWRYTTETHLAVHFDLHARKERRPFFDIHVVNAIPRLRDTTGMPVFLLHTVDASEDNQLRIPMVSHLKTPQVWRERLELLVRLFETQRDYSLEASLIVTETILWALATLHRRDSDVIEINAHIDPSIDALIGEMKDPRTRSELKRLSIAHLARRTGNGLTVFKQAFKAATGETPHKYIVRQDMEYGAYLLIESDATIKQVARSVGYEDPYHFSRRFHQIMGLSPSDYRKVRKNPDLSE
jgi:AraC-like DNA-binding protein